MPGCFRPLVPPTGCYSLYLRHFSFFNSNFSSSSTFSPTSKALEHTPPSWHPTPTRKLTCACLSLPLQGESLKGGTQCREQSHPHAFANCTYLHSFSICQAPNKQEELSCYITALPVTCLFPGYIMTSPRASPIFLFWAFFTVSSHRRPGSPLTASFCCEIRGTLPGPHPLPQVPTQSTGSGECLLCFNFLSS